MAFNYENPADYVARWRRVGPLLRTIGWQELREMTDEEHLRSISSVLALADPQSTRRTASGLVALQQLLARVQR